ncbi:MFS transporter [Candidatus Woesearchaeota archaeon]|nr:MFS transporter [Candidatus Woesearchaeota archaeon]
MGKITDNIPKFYASAILTSAYFFMPIYVIYLYNKGFSFTEIMLLEAFYAVIPVILEVPTGYFADVKGRKNSLIISILCMITAITVFLLGTQLWHFLASMVFWGISVAFWSGADSAIVYDTLLTAKQEKKYPSVWGKISFIMLASFAISSLIGGYAAGISLSLPFIMTAIASTGALFIILKLKEPNREKPLIEKGHLHNLMKISKEAIKNKPFFLITAYGVFFTGMNVVLFLVVQALALPLGVSLSMLGILFGLGGVAIALGMLIEPRIYNKKTISFQLFALAIASGASLLVLSALKSPWALLLLLLPALAYGMIQVAANTIINEIASSDRRATVLSVEGMALKISYGVFAALLGPLMDFSISLTLTAAALSAIIGSGLCALLLARFRHETITAKS